MVVPTHGFSDDTAALLDRLDGLVFSGGPDLDPGVYGRLRHPRLGPDVDRAGDEYELAMWAGAAERDLPVLGICRGMQALNVSRGGTLHQHLPDLTDLEHAQRDTPFAPAARRLDHLCVASASAHRHHGARRQLVSPPGG